MKFLALIGAIVVIALIAYGVLSLMQREFSKPRSRRRGQ